MESEIKFGEQGIDPGNGVPLYLQLKEIMREQIRSGAWQPGDRIPSEVEVRQHFDVSRATVRQAVTSLEQEGLLTRQQGRGTFVCKPKVEWRLRNFYSFTEDLTARGLHPESRLLVFEVVLRKSIACEVFGLGEKEPLIKLVRLRLAGGDPLMLETTYLPECFVPGLTEEDIRSQALYALLEAKYGMRLGRAMESFEPILVDEFASKMLEVPRGSPALYLERVGSLADGRRVELSQSVVRGDRCRYLVELM
ncbi:GntR family transcriptional regulator [Ktedonosporobacter rubrisoli]|uniref:GntR family transcriptional regulator n=1 Tax=Ktedonosporobacter rubrisoli TaxID=2509675 RepID=A0A4P6JPJ9_KTERU|nr:GntR family transcriptional regulator [Ktedonosporobacter rubrisoli]QBD77143.1 GntR family transcriptional regulator [Ktedonosporobacter rubrisoli]